MSDYPGATVPKNVQCGKALRHEKHDPHWWRCQLEDDTPSEDVVLCFGYGANVSDESYLERKHHGL